MKSRLFAEISSDKSDSTQEWLISTPKHLALYQAFGWEAPTFAHLGLLVADDGSKLSKRNDSVNLSTYRQQNIFPVAMQAWLANLGSSTKHIKGGPKTPEEILENASLNPTVVEPHPLLLTMRYDTAIL